MPTPKLTHSYQDTGLKSQAWQVNIFSHISGITIQVLSPHAKRSPHQKENQVASKMFCRTLKSPLTLANKELMGKERQRNERKMPDSQLRLKYELVLPKQTVHQFLNKFQV